MRKCGLLIPELGGDFAGCNILDVNFFFFSTEFFSDFEIGDF